MPVEFVFAARSDVGLLRSNNQDSAYAGPRLLVVADGMGGAAGGDIASSVVVGHLAPLGDVSGTANTMLENLTEALQSAHDELVERSSNDRRLRGLGTTCTALLRSGNKLAMVHIGDSRAYLLRDGQLTQVTADHSFVQYLIDTGQITKEEAENHPKRNYILRVLGDSPGEVALDETVREAVVGDRWLLCSDGLSGVVSDDTLQEVLSTYDSLDACADKLVELALLGGGPDNVTCVVADVADVVSDVVEQPVIVGAAAVDRNAPTKGTPGAAGRAAALTVEPTAGEGEEDSDEDVPPRRSHRWFGWALLAAIVIAVGAGLFAAWRWSQTQYYALGGETNVVIYQGIPQRIMSWELSRPVEVTDIPLSSLPEVDRIRLEDPVVRSSMEQIDDYLEELRQRGSTTQAQSRDTKSLLEEQKAAQKALEEQRQSAQSGDLSQSGEH